MYREYFKRLIDIIFSSIGLLLTSPLLIIFSILILLESRGPLLFIQKRVGKKERIFILYKLRTMYHEKERIPKEIIGKASAVTYVGYILRRFKFDELPQLYNVFIGDMSLVGPRPFLPQKIKEIDEIGKFRFDVRPGLTGLAQVNGNIHLSWPERWKYDKLYVEKLNLWLDIKIILKTIIIIMMGEEKFKRIMFKVLILGGVNSTAVTINKLHEHGFNIVGVLGFVPDKIEKVSGWYDLAGLCNKLKIEYKGFKKINESSCIEWASLKNPDIIFAVGISQLLNEHWMKLPKLGCIGFHPTQLPQGRGRAPIAWLILEERKGAATFFLIDKGIDDGPIFIQEPFRLTSADDALSVQKKILQKTGEALDKWLPDLKAGKWNPVSQDDNYASWYGKRNENDGLIIWDQSAKKIDLLIKAVTKPHPGAFTFFRNSKVIIWKSQIETEIKIKGVIGKILLIDEQKGYLVQCGDGLIWIKDYAPKSISFSVGNFLGYRPDLEFFRIWQEIEKIKRNLKIN